MENYLRALVMLGALALNLPGTKKKRLAVVVFMV